MNAKKNEVSFDARHNDWEEIANWPSEHPPTSDINTDVENRLLDGELLH